MIITLYGKKLECDLPKYLNGNQFKSVQLIQAVLPPQYFKASSKLRNNSITIAQHNERGQIQTTNAIVIPDGLYSIRELCEIIAHESKGLLKIEYSGVNNAFQMIVKKPYHIYFQPALQKFLGVRLTWNEGNFFSHEEPTYSPPRQYLLMCNLVNKNTCLYNGNPTNLLASLPPTHGDYEYAVVYHKEVPMPIDQSGFTQVHVTIFDEQMNKVKFRDNVKVVLALM